ncbi:hypothetical protein BHE74_00015914 [Ensete ventricosum]|nr:hypothetical protein BHE74_00015914 [Ensete ventricosum]RZS11118.1 hypothetical protein BHM03_00042414 [Ensete ventricosum]
MGSPEFSWKLADHPRLPKGKTVVVVVLDGLGDANPDQYNCIHVADTLAMDSLKKYLSMFSSVLIWYPGYGKLCELPNDDDMGNSEVGHNALGAGRIYAQVSLYSECCRSFVPGNFTALMAYHVVVPFHHARRPCGRPYDRWGVDLTCVSFPYRVGHVGGPVVRGREDVAASCLPVVALDWSRVGAQGPNGAGADTTKQELGNSNGARADPTEQELGNWNGAGADPTEQELGNLNGAGADPTEQELGNLNGAGADPTEQELGNELVGFKYPETDPTKLGLGK